MLKPHIAQLLAAPTPEPTIRDILESVDVTIRPAFAFEPSPIASIQTSMLAPSVTAKKTTKE
jgi:hypothetical protein